MRVNRFLQQSRRAFPVIGLITALAVSAPAQEDEMDLEGWLQEQIDSLGWQSGPATGSLGGQAQIAIPDGFRFLEAADSQTILQLYDNVVSGNELGWLEPYNEVDDWAVCFEFEDIGYVSDEDREDLDADAMLEGMKENQIAGNEYRAQQGMPPMFIEGWQSPPVYNTETNNLEWALLLSMRGMTEDGESVSSEFVNHNIRLLGREGVMTVTVLVDPEDYDEVMPRAREALSGFEYTDGLKYAEYREGDRLAEYGLAGLITGGALLGAAKLGILQKFWKLIVGGLVAVGVFFKKMFGKLTGKS